MKDRIRSAFVPLVILLGIVPPCRAAAAGDTRLPDGTEFKSWERPLEFSRTYYVDGASGDDNGSGTKERPFRTINKAAQVLQTGERVLIMSGVYRELVRPARGGTSPTSMISYEAAPGARVVVKGSRLLKTGWAPSKDFSFRRLPASAQASRAKVYQFDLEQLDLHGYNPFGMVNVLEDRGATGNVGAPPRGLTPYLLRRGMVFVDGKRLQQVELYREMGQKDGTFWPEYNGMIVHVRLPGDADPADHEVELVVQEQVFAPKQRHLGFIRVKGITFEHAASGFPIPQRGVVSMSRGHHWIVEECTIRHANSVALDIGNETWNADRAELDGYAIVRRNSISDAGICGIAGMYVSHTLIENNTLERIGWQDAEGMWESGAIKLHGTRNCLLRNNVVRHLRYAPGIWLDSGNTNTRVTSNVIGDLQDTLRSGIYLEISRPVNMLDHNIVWGITGADRPGPGPARPRDGGVCIQVDGTDEPVVAHNLLSHCEDAGLLTHTNESRGGTTRWISVLNNIFFDVEKSIVLVHREHTVDGNLYGRNDRRRGLNWIMTPEQLRMDLFKWQRYFGFDKHGAEADLDIAVDIDALTMNWSAAGDIPDIKTGAHFSQDFLGGKAGAARKPGPFLDMPQKATKISIDPR